MSMGDPHEMLMNCYQLIVRAGFQALLSAFMLYLNSIWRRYVGVPHGPHDPHDLSDPHSSGN